MLLSQRHPALYFLSVWEKRYRRRLKWLAHNKDYARKKGPTLPVRVKPHQSALIRKLGDSNMRLQKNKVVNLKIAAPLINGILIEPGQTFSFWRLVGRATAKRGFKEGMNLNNGEVKEGIGGGLCDTMKSSEKREIMISEGGIELKEFISTFFICLVVCWVATFFFVGLILNNIWAIIIVVAFLLAVLITAFMNQESRIEELEKKMEKSLNNKQD